MAIFNPNMPLGLPAGSVRSIIALLFTAVVGFLWATGQTVAPELLVTTGIVVTHYFVTRATDVTVKQTVAEVLDPLLAKPYIPSEHSEEK